MLSLQIIFHGKDLKSLHKFFGTECLPTSYGGQIEIPDGVGAALSDLFRLYGKEFDSMWKVAYDIVYITV